LNAKFQLAHLFIYPNLRITTRKWEWEKLLSVLVNLKNADTLQYGVIK